MSRITLFLLIDALGWEYVKNSPFLEGLFTVKNRLETVLGYSSAAIPSILTGKYPKDHRRWNLLYYSPETSPFAWTRFLHIFPENLLSTRFVRKIINVISKRIAGSEGYFSSYGVPAHKLHLFDLCEKKNIYRPGGIEHCKTIIDFMEETSIPYMAYSYHDGTDEKLFHLTFEEISNNSSKVYFLYLAELDAFLHAHCHNPNAIQQKLSWYDENIRRLVNKCKKTGKQLKFFIFSDHGMTPIRQHYDLIGYLKKNGVDPAKDCLSVFDSTMARFWTKDQAQGKMLERILSACPCGKLISKEEQASLGINFQDRRFGDIIFLMDPGTLIFPNFFGNHAPKGMHGFHPRDAHSYGAYFSNVLDHSPTRIVELFNIMKREALWATGRN